MTTPREHAQGGDLPPVIAAPVDDPIEQARRVFESVAAKADAAKAGLGRLQLVTMVGAGGLVLSRFIAIVDGEGEVLAGTAAPVTSEPELLALWQRICMIMAEAFDETDGSYFLERRFVDERGRPTGAPS